jgi:uncharacterized protein YdeI (BOF family)
MKTTIVAALLIALGAASPAFADDQGNANAEQQTQPTPNRGGTAGGPAHDTRPGETGSTKPGERMEQGHSDGKASKTPPAH